MKITITGQLFINSHNHTGRQDILVGKSNTDVEFNFESQGEKAMLRINRLELVKILDILDQGLM